MRRIGWTYPAAFVWGFAEATLFFVVPDVLITWIALRDGRRALVSCVAALAGALVGSTLMALLGHAHPQAMLAWLDRVPAIGPELIAHARSAMQQLGGPALMIGPFTGVPYKLYAAQALDAGLSLPAMLAWTVPARLSRFVLLALVANLLGRTLRPHVSQRVIVCIWALIWIVNYALYWSQMPS